jgi:hypothetical protein
MSRPDGYIKEIEAGPRKTTVRGYRFGYNPREFSNDLTNPLPGNTQKTV